MGPIPPREILCVGGPQEVEDFSEVYRRFKSLVVLIVIDPCV